MAKCLVVSILSVAAGLAQITNPGSIAGVVRDATTHTPLADVLVQMEQSSVTTDPQGRFAFRKVEPGRHWISAIDERRAGRGGVFALVSAGKEPGDVEISIKLGGTIFGRVIDEDKKPVPGASVLLLERRFESGEMAYARHQTVITGKDGRYRFEAVPSERSYLILVKRPLAALPADKVPDDPDKRERSFISSYYPGYRYAQDAQPVTLSPRENREGVDIRIAAASSYCMDGTVEGSSGTPLTLVAIMEHQSLVAGSTFAPVTAEIAAEGKFRACGFHPGDYRLAAVEGNVNRSDRTTAFAQVAITSHDVHDLKLVVQPPAAVSGDAVWDPPPAGKAAQTPVRVGLTKRIDDDRNAEGAGQPPGRMSSFSHGALVPVPGSFTIDQVPRDDYQLSVTPLPAGCYIKEAGYGADSVLHRLLRLTGAGADGRIRLVLACDGGSLTARVTDREGNPVSHVSLYAMPAGTASEAELRDVLQRAEVDKGWSAVRQPLPPGKYLVLASDVELDGTAEPILRLWRARSKAEEVEIGPNATMQVTLKVAAVE